jgi:hypothetical protein
MTARQKIENLTHAWYGYITLSAVAGLFMDGIPGLIRIFFTVMSVGFWLFVAWFLGRRLLHKGSLTRAILLVGNGLLALSEGWGIAKTALLFVRTWEFGLLAAMTFLGVSVYMHARTFRVLTDSSVRAYFN